MSNIYSNSESETFDLAGNNTNTISKTIQSAFASPLPITEMIRITFITGAGKLGRQRYDDNAARILTSTLRDLGYVEDRGASCVVECAGSYKSQHDTGKNLKTIVVFPNITDVASQLGAMGLEEDAKGPAVLEEGSPIHMIAMSSGKVFKRMVDSKCPSWSQKKQCLVAIQEVQSIISDLDSKLMTGTPFTESEQEFYDVVSMDALKEKETSIKAEMSQHVEKGSITKAEKDKLIHQVTEKIQNLEGEIKTAKENNKKVRVQKLNGQKEKALERKENLENITAKSPHPLRNQGEIEKLRKEIQPMIKIEAEARGRLLTLKETTAIAKKDDIEDEILILEEKSRGWFEEDDAFQIRVEASRAQARTRATKKVVKKKAASSNKSSSNSKKAINFIVPGARRGPSRPVAKKKSVASSNTFAMMMDSDSDSD